jgi:hypothetical protein
MENSKKSKNSKAQEAEFKRFAFKRIIVGILVTAVFLWVMGIVLGFIGKPTGLDVASNREINTTESASKKNAVQESDGAYHEKTAVKKTEHDIPGDSDTIHLAKKDQKSVVSQPPVTSHKSGEETIEHPAPVRSEGKAVESDKTSSHGSPKTPEIKHRPKGAAFVDAAIKPLSFELYERGWGWRPNDILDFTDNVNNFQLGVLEVTRRTVVILAERISRTGTTAAFDRNLENAMNWFMIKPDRYWFPSPESKYKDGLKELKIYKEKLEKGEANFHTRSDNLIPLLMAYEDLLGSCEENLVKEKEANGEPVSFFKSDDYFFYAKGVASAMGTILEAIMEDFLITVESRRGAEVLHHAIESCRHAAEIDPLIITNSSLSGILANHRANLAAPMSHARFYIGVLIKTLST